MRSVCTQAFSLFFAFAALDVYFPTTSVRFKLPINEESESIFSKIPLAQFQVLRLDNNQPALDHIYSLEENHLLRMNITSGEVFMRTDYREINGSTRYVLTAFPRDAGADTASTELLQQVAHLTLEVIPQSTADYCAELEHICFWSGAHYTIAETTSTAPFEPILVGALNSRAAKYLCPHRSVEYALKAGSTHFVLKQNRLYTRQPLDHDELNGLFARAGQLQTTISCTVKLSAQEQRQFLRSYNVTLLDRNDNGPRLQERQPHFNFHLEQPYFKTVSCASNPRPAPFAGCFRPARHLVVWRVSTGCGLIEFAHDKRPRDTQSKAVHTALQNLGKVQVEFQ